MADLKSILASLAEQSDVDINDVIDAVNQSTNALAVEGQRIALAAPVREESRRVFKVFTGDRIVQSNKQSVTAGLWSNNVGSLTTFFTNGTQTGSVSGYYYYDVYQSNPMTSPVSAEVQFSIAYGHVSGGGAPSLAIDDNSTQSTKAIYSQIRNVVSSDT